MRQLRHHRRTPRTAANIERRNTAVLADVRPGCSPKTNPHLQLVNAMTSLAQALSERYGEPWRFGLDGRHNLHLPERELQALGAELGVGIVTCETVADVWAAMERMDSVD